jgi:hypothetical protein
MPSDIFKSLERQMVEHLEANPGFRSKLWLMNEFSAYGFRDRMAAIKELEAKGTITVCASCGGVIAPRNFHGDLCSMAIN